MTSAGFPIRFLAKYKWLVWVRRNARLIWIDICSIPVWKLYPTQDQEKSTVFFFKVMINLYKTERGIFFFKSIHKRGIISPTLIWKLGETIEIASLRRNHRITCAALAKSAGMWRHLGVESQIYNAAVVWIAYRIIRIIRHLRWILIQNPCPFLLTVDWRLYIE